MVDIWNRSRRKGQAVWLLRNAGDLVKSKVDVPNGNLLAEPLTIVQSGFIILVLYRMTPYVI